MSASRVAANEVAAELRINTGGAQARLHLALAMDRLPGTRLALAAGRLDLTKTRAIVETTDLLDDAALPDGMAANHAVLPAPAAITCHDWLTALADAAKAPGDGRNLDQRRADVLSDLAAHRTNQTV